MKTRNLYYTLALIAGTGATAIPASAQDVFAEEATTVTEYTCDNTTRYFSNWRNNWFIEVDAGINQPFVERGTSSSHAVDRQKMTLTYGFGVGRWVSPYIGFRLKALGGAMHWDTPLTSNPKMGWTRAQHANLQAELMWDMFNSIGGVNDNRVFSIIPFVGFGGDAMWNYRNAAGETPEATNVVARHGGPKRVQWTLPVSAGLQFRLRLCEYVDFFAEARATFYGDNWNNVVEGNSVDANVAVLGGFNFNIGGRNFGKFNQCNYVSEIAALNGQVNNLRAELLGAGAEIAALQSQLPCPEPTVQAAPAPATPLLSTVRFTINSDKITPEEQVNVYNMAEWLKANPNQKVVIAGYADKDTGTSEYNLGLSERRANAVADELVNTYGINRNRLTVKADGSAVQPYDTNDWNRIVIFSQN